MSISQIGSPKSDFGIPGLLHPTVLDYLAPSYMTSVYSPKIGLFQKADTIRHQTLTLCFGVWGGLCFGTAVVMFWYSCNFFNRGNSF